MNEHSARKHPEFIVRQEHPLNGGPPLPLLRRSFVTPINLFYIRNHGNIPRVDPAAYRLEVLEEGAAPRAFTLDELRNNFPVETQPATLQCAGNRRQELIEVKPVPGEVAWGEEAIGHAEWTGVRLRDVLAAAGVQGQTGDTRHVDFSGLDDVEKEQKRFHFGGSIPLLKALEPEVLLAYAMNGQPLEPAHGFPLRVVVPGYIGARSVKWLSRITVQNQPSHNYFQRKSYRLFPPGASEETVNWEQGLMLGEVNLSSVICSPLEGESVPPGSLSVIGYAIASGSLQVARVDVSPDGGQSWVQAELLHDGSGWDWCFWQANLDLGVGQHELVVRAIDSAANSQPTHAKDVWNFKGYMNNAWNRVSITVLDQAEDRTERK